MTTTLDAVISFVRDEVNRGASADNVIPVKIMQAIQFIERNTNWKYMQKIFEFDLFTGRLSEIGPNSKTYPSMGTPQSALNHPFITGRRN